MKRDTIVLDQLIAEMRKHAADGREAAEAHRANATSHWEAAAREAKEAVSAANMANGWDETAYALERGVITLGDATVLYDLREQLGGAQDAIDPRLPFAQQREQLAAAEAAQLEAAKAYYTQAQIAGTACTDCGGPLAGTAGGFVTGETPAGRMFEHIDPQDCIKHVAGMRAGGEADDVYTAEERADDDAWAESASDYAASLEPGIEADL